MAESEPANAVVRRAAAASDGHEIVSFDVFDTVLTRRIGAPRALFLLLGRRLAARSLISSTPEAFALARREASRRAFRNHGAGWTLTQIYDELQFALGWSDERRTEVESAELELEHELTVAVPGAHEKLAQARARSGGVAFLSDMYLDSATLRSLLDRAGLLADGDRIYVSSETGCSKQDGAAFRCLAEREDVPVRQIRHYGNDQRYDIEGARRAGATAVPLMVANMNRYEEALENHSSATEGLASVMAGASRAARLSVQTATAREAALRDVAAGVGAPALVSYVLWLLMRARDLNVRRLYFLGRDGTILMRIARRLVEKLNLDCEIRHLHGGRKAWFLASASDVSQEQLFWAINHAAPGESIASFLRRLWIDPEEVGDALAGMGLPRAAWDIERHDAERRVLWSVAREPVIRKRILEQAARRRQDVLAYLEQEGLLEPVEFAVVDSGWHGRVTGALNRILADRGAEVRHAFLFARLHDPGEHNLRSGLHVHTWFADHHHVRGYPGHIDELFLGLFCGADEGATVGYAPDGPLLAPVRERDGNPELVRWGLPLVQQTIMAFVDALWLDDSAVNVAAAMRQPVGDVLQLFIRRPRLAEATAWSCCPVELGRPGSIEAGMAAPYGMRHVLQALRRGSVGHGLHAEWREAGMAMTPRVTRFALRACLAARRRLAARLRPWKQRVLSPDAAAPTTVPVRTAG